MRTHEKVWVIFALVPRNRLSNRDKFRIHKIASQRLPAQVSLITLTKVLGILLTGLSESERLRFNSMFLISLFFLNLLILFLLEL